MARNSLAGTKTGKSKSAKFFQKNEESRKKKNLYNATYHKKKAMRKYRSELNKANRDAGTYGNKDFKDMSHTKKGKLVKESQSSNRKRNGKNGKSTKK